MMIIQGCFFIGLSITFIGITFFLIEEIVDILSFYSKEEIFKKIFTTLFFSGLLIIVILLTFMFIIATFETFNGVSIL